MIELRKYGMRELELGMDPDKFGDRLQCDIVMKLKSRKALLHLIMNSTSDHPWPEGHVLYGYHGRRTTSVYGYEWVNNDGDVIFPM